MNVITGPQVIGIGRIFTDSQTPSDQAQALIDSGLLADLRDADVSKIDRIAFRELLGLPPLTADGFPIWKTIKLGTGLKTADEFRKALTDGGFKIGEWSNDILDQPAFSVALSLTDVELVNVSPRELGLRKSSTFKEICAKAKSKGLSLCPNEVGPQLRLQYKDQPTCARLLVAMDPIADSNGYFRIFRVGNHEDELWLDGSLGYPGHVWFLDDRFVFVRSKK